MDTIDHQEQRMQRRPQPRTPVNSEVRLHSESPGKPISRGTLVDIGPAGFRARYDGPGLAPGTIVYAWGLVPARVVWARSGEDSAESGFELLIA